MSKLHSHTILESVGHKDRGTTVVEAMNIGSDDDAVPLAQLVAALTALLVSIPEDHRESARVNIKAYGDYASAYVDVTYLRPETDEELAARRLWLAGIDRANEDRDKQEFERLQRKFGT